MTPAELAKATRAEYDRCMRLAQHPEESAPLYGVDTARVAEYYTYRAEAIGWVLDRMERAT